MDLLKNFFVEIQNPPGILMCGTGYKTAYLEGWIFYTDSDTMVWELDDFELLQMPVWGRA